MAVRPPITSSASSLIWLNIHMWHIEPLRFMASKQSLARLEFSDVFIFISTLQTENITCNYTLMIPHRNMRIFLLQAFELTDMSTLKTKNTSNVLFLSDGGVVFLCACVLRIGIKSRVPSMLNTCTTKLHLLPFTDVSHGWNRKTLAVWVQKEACGCYWFFLTAAAKWMNE